MKEVSLDMYMEHALVMEVNKLVCEKKDLTAARKSLKMVQDLNTKKECEKLNLQCACEEELDVLHLENSSDMSQVPGFKECFATSSICAYLPPSRDPTFHCAEAGYVMFKAVSVTHAASGGKGVRKHSDGLFVSLKSSGAASLKCQKAVQLAQKSQSAYFDASAALVGRDLLPLHIDKDEHAMIQLNVKVLQRFKQFATDLNAALCSAQVYVEEYYSFREASEASVPTAVSPCRKERIISDITYLRRLRDKSKHFSSDIWVCVLINKL